MRGRSSFIPVLLWQEDIDIQSSFSLDMGPHCPPETTETNHRAQDQKTWSLLQLTEGRRQAEAVCEHTCVGGGGVGYQRRAVYSKDSEKKHLGSFSQARRLYDFENQPWERRKFLEGTGQQWLERFKQMCVPQTCVYMSALTLTKK